MSLILQLYYHQLGITYRNTLSGISTNNIPLDLMKQWRNEKIISFLKYSENFTTFSLVINIVFIIKFFQILSALFQ